MKTAGIHKQLQELRKDKGKTQEELAEVFGVTNQAVSKWESGACYPDTTLLPEIANYLWRISCICRFTAKGLRTAA